MKKFTCITRIVVWSMACSWAFLLGAGLCWVAVNEPNNVATYSPFVIAQLLAGFVVAVRHSPPVQQVGA